MNRSRVDYELLPVHNLLAKAQERCRDRREHHNISIECEADLLVYGNRQELTSVITQLLDNACRYSPEGGQISLIAQNNNQGASISVTDQGIGIPKHELKSIFAPFHMIDTGDTRSTGGVGLGLYVARDIVTLHGGQLLVESTPGQGSVFTILMPKTTDKDSFKNNASSGTRES